MWGLGTSLGSRLPRGYWNRCTHCGIGWRNAPHNYVTRPKEFAQSIVVCVKRFWFGSGTWVTARERHRWFEEDPTMPWALQYRAYESRRFGAA